MINFINTWIGNGIGWIAELVCKCDNILIIVFGIVNMCVFFRTRGKIKKAENIFKPRNDKVNGISASMQWNNEQISHLKNMRREMIIAYTFYANITAIFPLLGILGTVAALTTYSAETMLDSFMVALGTTLLGVGLAFFYKSIDGIISGPMDVIVEDADYVIQEYESEKRRGNEA